MEDGHGSVGIRRWFADDGIRISAVGREPSLLTMLPPTLFGTVDTALAKMVSKLLPNRNNAAGAAFLTAGVDAFEGSFAGSFRQVEHGGQILEMREKKRKSANGRSEANGFRWFCC